MPWLAAQHSKSALADKAGRACPSVHTCLCFTAAWVSSSYLLEPKGAH